MRYLHALKAWPLALLGLVALLAVSCGGSAAPTATSPTTAVLPTDAPPSVSSPTSAPSVTKIPTAAPTPTPLPVGTVSARDSITLAIPEEPQNMNSLRAIGGGLYQSITRANLVDPLTWQSGDDLRIVPTSATVGWKQVAPDTWRFELREGVKFHNGEPWNAQAAVPNLKYNGNEANATSSFVYTGSYTAEAVDELTLDIICATPCPIFPNTAFFVSLRPQSGWLIPPKKSWFVIASALAPMS